jgi:glycosyltransferase involved in cell wall biosynthesis
MKFSVIIPAHNEAKFLPACLSAVNRAIARHQADAEIIVILNRCTDDTEQIAITNGARVLREDRRNLSAIRNTGARAATGDVLVTVDADSIVSENLFAEIEQKLKTRRYIGGGITIRMERTSPGIALTMLMLNVFMFFTRLSGGVYWCFLDDFRAIDGFNEKMPFGEDLEFARRLRTHGRLTRRSFTTLKRAYIITSCRKFDQFGDWHFFKMALCDSKVVRQGLQGKSTEFQDRYYYDFNTHDQ